VQHSRSTLGKLDCLQYDPKKIGANDLIYSAQHWVLLNRNRNRKNTYRSLYKVIVQAVPVSSLLETGEGKLIVNFKTSVVKVFIHLNSH